MNIKKNYALKNYISTKLVAMAAFIVAIACIHKIVAAEPEGVNYFYSVRNKPSPTVILAHGCGGIGRWNAQWSDRIEQWGYNVVSVDSFTKRGRVSVCGAGGARVVHPVKVRAQDMIDAAKVIRAQDWHKGSVIVIGASHGGAAALATAVRKDAVGIIDAAVALYPGCMFLNSIYGEPPAIPTQINLAGSDEWAPCTHLALDKQGFNSNGSQYFVYPGATHAFDTLFPGGSFRAKAGSATHLLVTDPIQSKVLFKNVKAFIEDNLN